MKNKKGQLTIFIIIAILIVAVVIMFFVFRGDVGERNSGNIETGEVYNYVQECMRGLAEQTIYDIGKGGGYSPFEDSLTWWNYTSSLESYYLIERSNYMPSKREVEDEISKHFNRNFYICKEEFYNFKDYEIEDGNVGSEVEILEDKVIFYVHYPLTITKGESSSIVTDFEIEVYTRINLVYDYVEEFMIKQSMSRNNFCLSCIPEEIEEERIFVEAIEDTEGTRIIFIDYTEELNGEPFTWIFVNKY